MDDRITNIDQIMVGDIVYNTCGHYVIIKSIPRFNPHYNQWVVQVTHVQGEYSGYETDEYWLTTGNSKGSVDGLFLHSRNNKVGKVKHCTIRDSKLKHYFI